MQIPMSASHYGLHVLAIGLSKTIICHFKSLIPRSSHQYPTLCIKRTRAWLEMQSHLVSSTPRKNPVKLMMMCFQRHHPSFNILNLPL